MICSRESPFPPCYRRTWCANQLLLKELETVVGAFESAGIETLILKGAALLALHYRDPGARPMQDLDLLIRPADLPRARQILEGLGWSRLRPSAPISHCGDYTDGRRNLLDLHWTVMRRNIADADDPDHWASAVPVLINKTPTKALDATNQLLHACVHGLVWNPVHSLRWVADCLVVIRTAPEGIDWPRFLALARRTHRTYACRAALGYLAESFAAPVPLEILRGLKDSSPTFEERLLYFMNATPDEGIRLSVGMYLHLKRYHRLSGRNLRLGRWARGLVRYLCTEWGLPGARDIPRYIAVSSWRRISNPGAIGFRPPQELP